MNEQENTRVVQQIYEAFEREDVEALLRLVADDAEWVDPGPAGTPTAGTWKGHDQIRRWFAAAQESYEFQQFEPRQYVAQGDYVVVLGYYRGTARTTGRPFESDWAMAFTLRDGKITRYQEYTDTEVLGTAFRGS